MVPAVVLTFILLNYLRAGVVLTVVASALAEQGASVNLARLRNGSWLYFSSRPGMSLHDNVKDAVVEHGGRFFRLTYDEDRRLLQLVPQGGGEVPMKLQQTITTALARLRDSRAQPEVQFVRAAPKTLPQAENLEWVSDAALQWIGMRRPAASLGPRLNVLP